MSDIAGEKNFFAKLTERDVGVIRGSSHRNATLAKMFGVKQEAVRRIRVGLAWPSVKPIFEERQESILASATGKWRPIFGYEGIYDISEDGLVRSWTNKNLVAQESPPPHLRKQKANKNGYMVISLWQGHKGKVRHIHHLVAEAFLGPRPKGMLVLHYDGDKLNNNASNLRYGTHQDNYWDAVKHGTRKSKFLIKEKSESQ